MSTAPRAVLFDMDGVLVRSFEVWFRVVEEAGRRFRGRAISREEFTPTFGQGTAADVPAFGLSCTTEELDRFYAEEFTRHLDQIWVDPHAVPALTGLRARGVRVGLVTNTVQVLTEAILTSAGLRGHLDAISCADMVARAKPAPDLVQHALTALGVSAAEAWMVGDSKYDREAARAAGVHFVGYGIDGDRRVETLTGLLDLVRGLSGAQPLVQ
nr:HAD-IA family hydrolase [Myxococcaceae bacterium]